MARLRDREKALALRKRELSYSQIKEILGVSKGTLSSWLREYPLSKERISELRDKNEKKIERFRRTMKQKREKRQKETYSTQKKKILPLKDREIFLAGLILYWGEGTKAQKDSLIISNSDPSVIRFFIYWLTKALFVHKDKIKIYLHLYSDMDVDKEIRYWSTILAVPQKQFNRPYIKKTSLSRINHKGGFGHGTCQTRINDALLAEKVFMSIKAISDYY
jgi:predicted transcriptional regulator